MRKLILLVLLAFSLQGCALFGANPNYTKELNNLKEKLVILKADYQPVKDKDGKEVAKPAMRPFEDEAKNDEFRKLAIQNIDSGLELIETMKDGYR